MSEKAKQAILIVVVILALVAAGFGAMSFMGGEKPEVVKSIDAGPGAKSEKEAALQGQAQTPAQGEERDLSGAPPGG
jgi:flagellar basal body-associated protein FliL